MEVKFDPGEKLAKIDEIVKIRDAYKNSVFVSGAVCLLLGVGNWVVGSMETSKFQSLLYKTAQTGLEESYRNFQELDQQKNEEVLRRINQNREKFNAARVKLNFYYVVLIGGRILFLLGLFLVLASLIRLIRADAQKNKQRMFQTG
ncbi:MAG: hypothetical protein OEN50_03470 [Deltaproteobacteria bacterium]|nr:hypothetical protein [Deltaproteobacteria bacterium]